ncbi:MAG: hypothetical protein NTY77_08165 [Elusimicrobia bacterium]|nr:hypothetical protein [Elusimicrobiota bacterium]
MKRSIILACAMAGFLCAIVGVPASQAADSQPQKPAQEPASLPAMKSVLDAPLEMKAAEWTISALLERIAKETKASFVVREGLEQEKVKTVAAKAPAKDILQKTLGSKNLAFGPLGTDNVFFVMRSSKTVPKDPGANISDPAFDKLVTVGLKNAAVESYLKAVTQQAGVKLGASDELAKTPITVSLQKVTAREALYALAMIKGWTYSRNAKSGVYEFSREK